MTIVIVPDNAWAWGPVTHVMLGIQTIAFFDSATAHQALRNLICSLPEVFLYGGLAPDIVQGRRLQSRLRRHSHNWDIAFELYAKAEQEAHRVFALGYLAHLACDVVAHNFYLPTCYVANYTSRLTGHIYFEACFDAAQEERFQEILLNLLELDFSSFDQLLEKAIESPILPFATHRKLFEGGLKRIRQWNKFVRATGGLAKIDTKDVDKFCLASQAAIVDVLLHQSASAVCRFDPMGAPNLRNATKLRQSLRSLARMGGEAAQAARKMSDALNRELRLRLAQLPFLPAST